MCGSGKLSIIGIVTGAIAIGYTFYVQMRVGKVGSLIDASINELSGNITVDISKEIIDKAVDKAVDREVDKAVRSASYSALENVRKDIQRAVRTSVDDSYSDIRASVSNEVSRQVANIDMDRLKAEVREEAKALVITKFDDNLDSLLQDFNQSLSNVRKIYDSIADSVASKKQSDTVFRIGN